MNTLLSGERSEQEFPTQFERSPQKRRRTNPAEKVGHFSNYVQYPNEAQTTRQARYNNYLLSPEWRELKRMVRARCLNVCEVCRVASVEATHHLTYKRFGRERLSDLLGVCDKCHEKIHNIKNNHLIPLVFGGDGVDI